MAALRTAVSVLGTPSVAILDSPYSVPAAPVSDTAKLFLTRLRFCQVVLEATAASDAVLYP